MGHPLGALLTDAAHGQFPEPDGSVEIVPPWRAEVEGVVALTGRAYVVTNRPEADVIAWRLDGYGRAVDPRFVTWLAGSGGWCDCLDMLLVSFGTGAGGPPRRDDLVDHPRAKHARLVRGEVCVSGDARGLVTLGVGVGGLAEMGVEIAPELRGHRNGRSLVRDALGLVPLGEPVLAAIAPGNAAAVRTFLAAGFRPLGSVHLVRPNGADR